MIRNLFLCKQVLQICNYPSEGGSDSTFQGDIGETPARTDPAEAKNPPDAE